MKYLKKIFELRKSIMTFNDPDLVHLQELIEDTLGDFKVEVTPSLPTDSYLDDESSDYVEYTTSVEFSIEPQLPEYKFMEGNPYSGNSIDIEESFKRQQNYVDSISKFTREIKSLCFRLSKSGYVISAYKFDGVTVNIWFMVENEKIVKN